MHVPCSYALGTSLPILAATLSFVTYTLTTNNFNIGAIFTSLSLFQVRMSDARLRYKHNFLCHQLLRQPMMWMPRALSSIPDASFALQRLSHIFHAELRGDGIPIIDPSQEYAISVRDATFEWESLEKIGEQIKGDRRALSPDKDSMVVHRDEPVFRVSNVMLNVPRGQLVAIVGPVGSGKVCMLHAVISPRR